MIGKMEEGGMYIQAARERVRSRERRVMRKGVDDCIIELLGSLNYICRYGIYESL